MPYVHDLVTALDAIAPFALAEEWDNVGLLVGRPEASATKALLTIDLTPAVAEEAIESRCDVVIAYHPPLFRPLKRLTAATSSERTLLSLIEHRIAVISPHTALDAAPDGLNDWIASGIGEGDVRALIAQASLSPTQETKIVTICPADAVDRVRDALAAVGAGIIGAYTRCSFEQRVTGTFFANEGATPTVGEIGQLNRVEEVRLEMVCSRRALALAVQCIHQFHPYDTPPIEIYPLLPRPQRGHGAGRRLTLDAPLTIADIATRLRTRFGIPKLRYAAATTSPEKHTTIGISAGSGATLLDAAVDQDCTLFVTGELKHHEALAALTRGCGVIVAGHTNTERGYLPVLGKAIASRVAGVTCAVSKRDRDPFADL